MKFAESSERIEFEQYEIMDTHLSEIQDDSNSLMDDNVKSKIIIAFNDNHYDLLKAKRDGDYEEELVCRGFEQAMSYVLSLYGITYDEALVKRRN